MPEDLARWLGRDDLRIDQILGGASNLTFRVRTGDDDWILRRPPAVVTATSHDMEREWTVLRGLASTDVPVPRVVRTCDDTSVLGAPFYLMERLDGIVFRSADDVGHLDEGQARACTGELVDVLVALHAVDPAAVGLQTFGRPEGFLERQVRRWARQWELTKFAEVPDIDETVRRLGSSLPARGAPAIVHGDYSFNNTIFRREPPATMAGVLDWELSTLGDPLADVGMLVLYWGEIAESIWTGTQAHRSNPGFGTSEELLQRYASVSKRDLDDIGFYVALATLKMAVIMAGTRVRVADADPERARQLETKARLLASVALEAAERLSH
ncbi:MAG: phosphotransferase family protein [Frankia sp.]